MQIFQCLFNEPDIGAIGRFFGKDKKVKAEQVEQAKALLPTLVKYSDVVCDLLEQLEGQLTAAAKKKQMQKSMDSIIENN